MKHSRAVLCGELKATFGTDLVCAAVRQVKTMYCELWLWPYACVTGVCASSVSVARGPEGGVGPLGCSVAVLRRAIQPPPSYVAK